MRRGIDYHIHTFYQKCGNETLTVEGIIRRAETMRLSSIAITDHLNHFDHIENFRAIKRDLDAVDTDIEVFFGCELNYQGCDGEWAYSEAIRDDYGFQIAIGGIHSAYTDSTDKVEVIDIQHRHHMRALEDPLIDVLVHPYWFGKGDLDKRAPEWWQDLMETFPAERITELADASRANNSGIEVNTAAVSHNAAYSDGFQMAYNVFVKSLAEAGALFTVGSDAHDINTIGFADYGEGLLDGLGVWETQRWQPAR